MLHDECHPNESPTHCLRVCPTAVVTCFALLLLLLLLVLLCSVTVVTCLALLLLLLLLLATAVTTVACYCCYLLLLLLATAVTTVVPCHCCYSLHCCYLLQYLFPVHGQLLAPLIRQLGIVCLVTRSFLAPLLSYYFAADTLLADTNLSGEIGRAHV